MADKIELEVSASTAAAVSEVKKLNTALTESTTAAKGAGAEQKSLGKSVSETKAKQQEATEAIRRAKEAQQEHNLTVQAFGPKSREAAESAKRLAAANDESKRAAVAAAKALESVAKEASAAAKAEGDQLSPATKRAAAALEVMAKDASRAEGELRRLELQTAKAGKELQSYEKFARGAGRGIGELAKASAGDWQDKQVGFFDRVSDRIKGLAPYLAVGGGVVAGMGAFAMAIGEASSRALELEAAAAALKISIDGAKKSTGGLISDYNLMTAANSAVGLGVVANEREFAALAEAATKLALKTGTDVTGAVGNLVTALGRGSTELLDNYGVVMKVADAQAAYALQIGKSVDALTEEEKKSAFKIVALQKIKEAADTSNISLETGVAKVASYNAKWDDFKDRVSLGVTKALGGIAGGVMSVSDALTDLDDLMGNSGALARMQGGAGAKGIYDDPAKRNKDSMDWARKQANPDLPLYEETAREKRVRERLEREEEARLDEEEYQRQRVGAGLPPTTNKKKGSKKKQVEEVSSDSDHGGRVFNVVAGIEDSNAIAYQASMAAEAEAAAQSEALSEARLAGMDRELEAMDAMDAAKTEQIDRVFYQVEVETEAEARRAELQDERIKRESELARWQLKNAKTDEQREKAQTRLEETEHKKRILAITRHNKEEERAQAKRASFFEGLNRNILDLGSAMLDGIEAQAKGEKGAIAESVAIYAKGIRNKMILKALEETALGAAALAGIVTAGLAAPHFVAAGLATAAAVAAGGAQAGFHALAESQGLGAAKKDAAALPSSTGAGSGSRPSSGSGSSGGGGGDGDGVPTSYNDGTAYTGKMAYQHAKPSPVSTGPITVLGATTEQVGNALKKIIKKSDHSLGSVSGR